MILIDKKYIELVSYEFLTVCGKTRVRFCDRQEASRLHENKLKGVSRLFTRRRKMNSKVVVYLRNKEIRPSDYYRFVQYIDNLKETDITIRSSVPTKLDRFSLDHNKNKLVKLIANSLCYFCIIFTFFVGYFRDKFIDPDWIVVVREIFPVKIFPFSRLLLLCKVKQYDFIWDYDDSIIGLEMDKKESDIYCNYAKHIIVSTPYLKEQLPKSIQNKTKVLSTTDGALSDIDLERINHIRNTRYKSKINIVWVATSSNLPNLIDILDYLDVSAKELKEKHRKELELLVVCNNTINSNYEYLKINNITWSRDSAKNAILSAHIGIMPLIDNTFSRGKAGFKLVQYLSGGVPVIASDVGYNKFVVDKNVGYIVQQDNCKQWVDAILSLSTDIKKWEKYSLSAKDRWEKDFSYDSHLLFWQELLLSK